MTEASREIGRQIAVLVDRKGKIDYVIVGDAGRIFLPDFKRVRTSRERFRGLRCLHTHLKAEPLSHDDLTDLALLRLDLIGAIGVGPDGRPARVHLAHLLPPGSGEGPWTQMESTLPELLRIDCRQMIQDLEREFTGARGPQRSVDRREKAILIGITTERGDELKESMEELQVLAESCGLAVVDQILQHRPKIDHKFVVGRGKLEEIIIRALQLGTDMMVFDRDLTPAQVRSISDSTDLKIIDRTQLILDIFAQRARSRDGKIQVELAQLRYLLPRLITKNTAMSRLTGGIGGRGPGETKLEIGRRRARDRIARLERELRTLRRGRTQRRQKRRREQLPIISIIGYTNAGKSTLLNTLTGSDVFVEDRPFATLDPVSRRLRFPRERDVIITDTVGFIKDLPDDLVAAFRATLEELEDADLLLHLVDISSPYLERHIAAVEKILAGLDLSSIPRLLVFNKADNVGDLIAGNLSRLYGAFSISALDKSTLGPLMSRIEYSLWGSAIRKRSSSSSSCATN